MQIIQRQTSTNVSGITLRPLPGSPMLATSWSTGFVLPRSPLSCQCISSCGIKYNSSAISRVATSVEWWKYPWHKRRVNKSTSRSPRHINLSLRTWTRWCPLTRSSSSLSSSSVKQPSKQLAFLRRSPRIKSSQKKRKLLIFLLRVAVNRATSSIVATSIATIIEGANTVATIADLTIVIETIDITIILIAAIKTQRTASPTKTRMITSVITSTKRPMRPCTMTSPLCRAQATHPEKGVTLAQGPLSCSCSQSCSCSSSRSYDNHHVATDDCKPSALPKCGYLYSKDNNEGHCHPPDKDDTIFATFSAPLAKKGECVHK